MPTFSRLRLAAAAAVLLVAGCEQAGLSGGNPTRTSVNVAGRGIEVAGPPGFCIDSASTSVSSAGAFVLMADCSLLGAGDGAASTGAALTASISTGGLGGEGDDPVQSLQDLEAFVGTADGLALVGRSGQSRGVRILASEQQGDVFYVLVEDAGPQPIAGIERRFWRAFLDLDGHLAVLSVLGFEGAGAGSQAGLDLLAAFAAAMKAANGSPGPTW